MHPITCKIFVNHGIGFFPTSFLIIHCLIAQESVFIILDLAIML